MNHAETGGMSKQRNRQTSQANHYLQRNASHKECKALRIHISGDLEKLPDQIQKNARVGSPAQDPVKVPD